MKFASTAIGPSLLAADFARLADEIHRVEEAGADFLHLDVMDAHFVPNISFGIPVIEAVRRVTSLKLDTHLMMSQPGPYLEAFRDAGADSLTLHAELGDSVGDLLDTVRGLDIGCGLAVNPGTSVEALFPYLDRLDLALVMSVEPGFGGQRFMPQALDKIEALKQRIEAEGLNLPVEIDGGVNADNAGSCTRAGASLLVAGSSVFGAPDATAAVAALRT